MSSLNPKVKQEAREVPKGIRRATAALSDDRSYSVIVHLLKQEGSSFSEIMDSLNLHQQKLSNSLNKLMDGGIVVRKEVVQENSEYRTRYEVTEFGKRLLDGLYDAREPQLGPETEVLPLYDPGESEPYQSVQFVQKDTLSTSFTPDKKIDDSDQLVRVSQ